MTYRRRLGASLFALPLAMLGVLAACAMPATGMFPPPIRDMPSTPSVGVFPMTVRGEDGRSLVLARPARRIVSLSPGHTEVLFAIGAGEALVGVDEYSDFPPEARSLPRVGYSNVDLERIVSLSPDLVIVVTRQQRVIAELDRLGVSNLYLPEAPSLDGLLERIVQLGDITARRTEAEALTGTMRRRIEAIMARLEGVQGYTAFYELGPELFTVAPETFIGDMLGRLKLRNIAAGAASPFPRLSQEQVIASDPEVILLGDTEAGETPATVAARPGWQSLRAVRTGRVIAVPNRDVVHRPGPRVVEGMELLARALYPDRFP